MSWRLIAVSPIACMLIGTFCMFSLRFGAVTVTVSSVLPCVARAAVSVTAPRSRGDEAWMRSAAQQVLVLADEFRDAAE